VGTQLKTEVKLNGVDVAANLLKWRIFTTFGQNVSESIIELTNGVFSTVPDLANGQTITIKRGPTTGTENFLFEGIIDEVNRTFPTVSVKGKDLMIEALRNEVTKSYDIDIDPEAGVGSEIFKDLINRFTPLTADNTSVQSTGTINVITKFICNHTDVYQRLVKLAEIFQFQFYYNQNTSLVHFEPRGFVDKTADVLQVGVNVNKTLKWQFDNSQCVNDLTIQGAVQETEVNQTFDGDASTTVFTLSAIPIVVKIVVDGVEQTLGVPDSTSTFDYSVDKESKQIRFEAGSVPGSGTDNIVVDFTTPKPVPVKVKNSQSITDFGRYRTTKHFNDVQTVTDARDRGEKFVAQFGVPFTRVRVDFLPDRVAVAPGELRRVLDTQNAQDRNLVATKVTCRWPETQDIAHCGDREYKTWEYESKTSERIKRLEEELIKNQDLLVSIEPIETSLRIRKRFTRIKVRDYTGTLFLIWDHPQFGIWDSFKWGDDVDVDIGLAVQKRLIWPNEIYEEEFFDNEFEDTGVTTATWGPTDLTLGAGEVAQSEIAYENNETYSNADMTVTFSGDVTFKISSNDGGAFTTFTPVSGIIQNVTITSTNGTQIVWRAESTTGGTVTKVLITPKV